jgi:hypothetical protein
MAREDGIRASREILSIMEGMPVNEKISVLVFVLSSIYSMHEITKPIEDCADEIKEEFIKNFNKINE